MVATDTHPSRRLLLTFLVTAVAVGVAAVVALVNPRLGAVVFPAALALFAGVAWQRRCQGSIDPAVIERLDSWVHSIDAGIATDAIANAALDIARELTGARCTELVLFRQGVGWQLRRCGDNPDRGWQPLSESLSMSGLHAEIAESSRVLVIRRSRGRERAEDVRRRTELLGGAPAPARLVPVHGTHARGTLLVASPIGGRFPPPTDANLQLLAAHTAGALDASLVAEQVRNASARQLRTATTDVLTGLPNRAVFVDRVDDAARLSSTTLLMAVLLVNLDRFREINATFGHHVGDHLLKQFGTRLRDALPVTATVARLGGDEFAVLLCELRDQHTVRAVANELLDDLRQPYTISEASLQLEASMGIALAPLHADNAVRLLQRADIAMEAAKRARSGVEFYDPSSGTHDSSQLRLLADLRKAVDTDELSLVYQPKAALRTHTVHGVEALLRWNHATRGRVSPGEFIPIAERTGLIHPLTRWVLRTVLAQQRTWLSSGLELEVAVNLSARNLLDDTLPGEIASLLDEYGLSPHLLRLEITESSLIVDPGRAEAVLAELNRLGISLSVDDFGTGYSSLAHLLRLPVDEIKVDQSFVSGLLLRKSEAAIVRATVDLGRRLAITVTAEGVEDRETWAKLAELGCDLGQGFWLARPMDSGALERWLYDYRRVGIDGVSGPPVAPTPRPAPA